VEAVQNERYAARNPCVGSRRDTCTVRARFVRQDRGHKPPSSTVKHIERIEFEGNSVDVASAWLRERLPTDEKLVIVFGEKDCIECASSFFLDEIEVGQRVL
jgi:hypothetical protein